MGPRGAPQKFLLSEKKDSLDFPFRGSVEGRGGASFAEAAREENEDWGCFLALSACFGPFKAISISSTSKHNGGQTAEI